VFLLSYAVSLDEARDGTQKNTQGVWPCKLPIDSLPLQKMALSPAIMSCMSKQPRWFFLTSTGYQKRTKKSTRGCWTWIRMVCYWVKSCLTMICLANWAAVRPEPPPTPICQVAITEGWLWHTVSLWWHSLNMIMIHNYTTSMFPLYTVKLDTVSGDDMGPRVPQTKKKHVHVVELFEQHMSGTTITYICFLQIV